MLAEKQFYVGLDVHVRSTDIAIRSIRGDLLVEGKCSSRYSDIKSILEPYLFSCVVGMEASTCFYPLYDCFKEDNVDVKIANVLHLRQLIVKTDKLDAKRLSDMLRLGTFPESFIPPKRIQKLRDLVTVRHNALNDLTRLKARLWAAITRKGIVLPQRSMFSKKSLKVLELYIEKENVPDLRLLYKQYIANVSLLEESTKQSIEYAKKQFCKSMARLQEIYGIAEIGATYIVSEVMPVERFANKKKLRRYAGIVPSTKESGGKCHSNSIPKSSSRSKLRWILTQAAHTAVKEKGSRIKEYYDQRKKTKKGKAIIAVARMICDEVHSTLKRQ